MLSAVIVAAAIVAGVTGAWSPCGFSMVETLAPAGYAGRLRTTAIACMTFAAGALVGGVVTFGGLALLGSKLGTAAPAVAAVVALTAALAEARGARIVPQVRRQVPESWRRLLPVPLAAGLYGILLGLGFTTFILSFAVWALAAVSVALGDPALGVLIGLGFGVGRALPVIALAPSGGGALHAAMAERPRILRSLRALDAVALLACAAALWAAPAQAATVAQVVAQGFTDPSVDGPTLALHRPGGAGELRGPNGSRPVPGSHPAVGEGRTAWIANGTVVVDGRTALPAPGADAVAISSGWVAWRAGPALFAVSLDPAAGLQPRQVVAGAVGRPFLTGGLLVYAIDGRIESLELVGGVHTLLRSEPRAQLLGPSVFRGALVYIKATYRRQQVLVGPLKPGLPAKDRALYGTVPSGFRDAGHEPGRFPAKGHINKPLWQRAPAGVTYTLTTTAVGGDAVYVTRVRQRRNAPASALVLRIQR